PPDPGADDGWALFLDVDGTLLDFASTPQDVHVDARLHEDLASLRERLRGAVALLSGRSLQQIDQRSGGTPPPAAVWQAAHRRPPAGGVRKEDGEPLPPPWGAVPDPRV